MFWVQNDDDDDDEHNDDIWKSYLSEYGLETRMGVTTTMMKILNLSTWMWFRKQIVYEDEDNIQKLIYLNNVWSTEF